LDSHTAFFLAVRKNIDDDGQTTDLRRLTTGWHLAVVVVRCSSSVVHHQIMRRKFRDGLEIVFWGGYKRSGRQAKLFLS